MADKPSPMGDARNDLLWFIVILVVIGLVWVATGGPNREAATGGAFIYAPYEKEGDTNNSSLGSNRQDDPEAYTKGSTASTWQDKVRLEKGTAARATRSQEEYVTIRNSSRESVTISGWSLKNGAEEQAYRTSDGRLVAPRATWVVIPNGAKVFYPGRAQTLAPITLAPGERAIITSGRILDTKPYVINASFRTNICTGYLGEAREGEAYTFEPPLSRRCPDPEREPGFNNLLESCREVVEDLAQCETPTIKNGGDEINGVTNLSSSCRNYIIDHFSYAGCLKYHAGDSNFNLDRGEWRVFLNQGELWRASNESISLYDNLGRLVDRLTY